MTLVSDILTDAYRQSNLLAIGGTLTTNQQTEALRHLNRIVKSVLGNEVGEPFTPVPLGRLNIERPSGWPWYENFPEPDWFVPENSRLMCNLTGSGEVFLHPTPDDGSRLSVIDVGQNLSTFPLTLNANGRRIEGQPSVVLNNDGYNAEWLYRADLGEWRLVSPLTLPADFPFPEEFDFYFITLLAMALNPAYGVTMDPQTQLMMVRSRSQIRSRYHNNIPTRSELGLIRSPLTSQDRWYTGTDFGWDYSPDGAFKAGIPF
jgi:hypothetical protein